MRPSPFVVLMSFSTPALPKLIAQSPFYEQFLRTNLYALKQLVTAFIPNRRRRFFWKNLMISQLFMNPFKRRLRGTEKFTASNPNKSPAQPFKL